MNDDRRLFDLESGRRQRGVFPRQLERRDQRGFHHARKLPKPHVHGAHGHTAPLLALFRGEVDDANGNREFVHRLVISGRVRLSFRRHLPHPRHIISILM